MQVLRREDTRHLEVAMVSRYASIIFLGAWAMIAQIVLIREFLVVFYGNELILGVVIGCWLIGVSFGAISAGILSRRFKNDLLLFITSQVIALIILPIAILIARNVRNILNVPTGLMIPFIPTVMTSFLLVIPATFANGFCFPLASRMLNNIGKVYILEGLGAFLAGAAFSFVLAGRVDHFTIIFVTALLVLLNLALLSRASKGIIYSLILLLILGVASKAGLRLDRLSANMRLKSINPKMQLLDSVDTKYQNIAIAKLAEQLSVLCDGQIMFSFPDEYNQEIFVNLLMAQHPEPKRILLIGSGIAGEIYQILKYPVEKLDYVELDPELIRVTAAYLLLADREALNDRRLSIIFSDGRLFVNKTQTKYDLIIVNIADASTAMLNRFYTKEFFREIKRILKKDGVFTTSLSSAVNYLGPDIERYVGSIYRTLKAVFEFVVVTPGDRNQFFCSDSEGVISSDADVLKRRYSERNINNRFFRPQVFDNAYFPERIRFLRSSLEATQSPLNTDSRPISYYFNLILWNLFSGSAPMSVFRKLSEINLFSIVLLALAAFLLIRIGFIARGGYEEKQRFNSCWAIFTTGFAAMAFEIIIIFSFQNLYGYVYERIGLIIGIFMLGMISAAALSNSMLMRLKSAALVLLSNEILIVIFALSLITLRAFYIPSILGAGFLTGMEFPLAAALYSVRRNRIGFTAGVIDCADLAGACLGVILTGTVFVPLLGIAKTCLLIATLKLSSAIFLCLSLFIRKR